MSTAKPSRRKSSSKKLEPIDWHEFANDAVLNGNMSTLYQRPASEDATAYASPEALREIEKRGRPRPTLVSFTTAPTVGAEPTVGVGVGVPGVEPITEPTVGVSASGMRPGPAVGPTVGLISVDPREEEIFGPTVGSNIAGVPEARPTVGLDAEEVPELVAKGKIKPLRDVQDGLTLAGHVLYKAMYGAPDGARSKTCSKGYRQLANETHLDKDTVRDLISEFKGKGMVREVATYDPDTRSAKSYDVLSYKAILQLWREAGLQYVTTGRKRPVFCTVEGEVVEFKPTVGPVIPRRRELWGGGPTVGSGPTVGLSVALAGGPIAEVVAALEQITHAPVDQEAAERLLANCRAEAADCTVEEILEFAWSKAFVCRSGKIASPVGFLIMQVPKHFQSEALRAYREKKRTELESSAGQAGDVAELLRQTEREWERQDERHRQRVEVAERHRREQGIDLRTLQADPEADETLQEWARRMLRHGSHQPHYA